MDRLTVRDEFGNADIIALMDVMLDLYNVLSGEEMIVFTHTLNKLAYYEDLEEQGRLVILPIGKGDSCYVLEKCKCGSYYNCRLNRKADARKKAIYIGEKKTTEYGNTCLKLFERPFKLDYLHKVGKTVFLTREEAEAKLKEMESNDRDS